MQDKIENLFYCLHFNKMTKIILLSDLECDFINTKQGCQKLNQVDGNIVYRFMMALIYL